MVATAKKLIGGVLAVTMLAAQLLMAQHMALHLDGAAHLGPVAAQASHARPNAVHADQDGDDDHCAVCFFAKFIFAAMAAAAAVLVLPRFFITNPVFSRSRVISRVVTASYDACGPPLFLA
ncbi:MAG: hypothetical protein KGL10_05180 [Alphaproteobacteria bacterium]|nr:hypothetical protein [Alphaproteobacteria bacterium]MDE2336685.1 hypothetical protein [Alphaproteobacteria bacterium]